MAMIKRIPPSSLNDIKKKFDLTHLVLWCKSEEGQYIIANGNNADNCVQSTLIGNKFKSALGWPEATMPTPQKLADLLSENHKLKAENEKLKSGVTIPCEAELQDKK